VQKSEKEQVVAELTERLRQSPSLIVADYRGLTNADLVALRAKVRGSGGRFQVVKNTLTRMAAEEAGTEALLALLEGPTAIAFLESGGDPVAVAKALSKAAKDTQVLALRGGVLQGKVMTSEEVESLATLPAVDVLRGEVLGAITAPLTTIVGLFNAPLQNLIGLIDARIEQLEAGGDTSGAAAPAAEAEAPVAEASAPEAEAEAPAAQAAEADAEPEAAADTEATATAVADQEDAAPTEPETTTEEEGEDT
jgi:large subunit ribosomal protein L10